MRKDAKIALCVILVLMVLVVIIWGRSPRPEDEFQLERDQATATDAVTIVETPPPPPTDAAVPNLDEARRLAPAASPADTASISPPAMINHVPERARIVHEGAPPLQPRHALDDLPPAAPGDGAEQPTPPAAPPKPAPTAKPKFLATHKVAKGDNYTRIAHKYYRDANKWRLIHKANRVPPGALHIGLTLKIPHLPDAPAVAAAPSAAKPAPSRTHTVRKGESFYSIARTVYRDPGKWQKLYQHNRARLPKPADPSSLRIGTVIALPDLASIR